MYVLSADICAFLWGFGEWAAVGASDWPTGTGARQDADWIDVCETSAQVSVCHVASPPRALTDSSTYWMHYRLEPMQLRARKCVCASVCEFVCLHSSSAQEHFYPL